MESNDELKEIDKNHTFHYLDDIVRVGDFYFNRIL